MPLNVNGYSQDFQSFVDFASKASKGREIAHMDGIRHTVAKASSGGVGGFFSLFRSQENKNANDVTRILFKQSVVDIFGSEDQIPESVKKQMSLDDFDKGKPLTARRVLAVKVAIDQHLADVSQLQTNVATAKANASLAYAQAGPAGKAQLDAHIATIIQGCSDDPELLNLVTKYLDDILVGGDNNLRSAESVQAKLDGLRANLQEIRELSKKTPALKNIGLQYLDQLRGKSIPQGLIGKIVAAAKTAPIKDLTSLSASSSAWDIHRGVKQFVDGISKAIDSTGASRVLEGGDELNPTRALLESLIVSRFSKGNLQNIHDALESTPASKLLCLYESVMTGRLNDSSASPGVKDATVEQGSSYTAYIDRLKQAVDEANGIPRDQVHPVDSFRRQFNMSSINGNAILSDMVASARSKLSRERDSFINQTVQGDVPVARFMRTMFRKVIPAEVYDAGQKIQDDASPCSFRMFNASVACDCKHFADGVIAQTTFAKDLQRGFVFMLGDTRLSTDLNTAMNEVARYVAKDPNATYAGLAPKAKATANLIMSMYGQEMNKAAEFGFAKIFDPKHFTPAFMLGMKKDGQEAHTIRIDITSDHKLFMDYKCDREVDGFVYEGNFTPVGDGSQVHAGLHVEIDADEFDRLTSLDYTKMNVATADLIENGEANSPAAPSIQTMPQFKMDPAKMKCMVDFSANFN